MRALPDWPKERYLELSPKYRRATRGNLLPADLDSPLCAFTVPPAALNFAGSRGRWPCGHKDGLGAAVTKLHTLAKSLREMMEMPPDRQLSFEDKIGLRVDTEWTSRENRRVSRRVQEARLSGARCV